MSEIVGKGICIRPACADDAVALADILTSVGTFDGVLPPVGKERVARVATNLDLLVARPGHDLLVAETGEGASTLTSSALAKVMAWIKEFF